MSAFDDIQYVQNFVSMYASDAAKQFNLGWTVTPLWYVGAFLLGILILVITHALFAIDSDYKNNTQSKTEICVFCFIGLFLIIFGLWMTVSNFYAVVKRINLNADTNANSLFFRVADGPESTVDKVVSNSILPRRIYNEVQSLKNDGGLPAPRPAPASNVIDTAKIRKSLTGQDAAKLLLTNGTAVESID